MGISRNACHLEQVMLQPTLMEVCVIAGRNVYSGAVPAITECRDPWVLYFGKVARSGMRSTVSHWTGPIVRVCTLQASTPASMTPGSARKSGWGRSKTTKKSRLSTAECTSIVDGLKLIYFTRVRSCPSSCT